MEKARRETQTDYVPRMVHRKTISYQGRMEQKLQSFQRVESCDPFTSFHGIKNTRCLGAHVRVQKRQQQPLGHRRVPLEDGWTGQVEEFLSFSLGQKLFSAHFLHFLDENCSQSNFGRF